MKSAIWNLSDFNISMVSKYGDLYELESDIMEVVILVSLIL